MDLCNILVGTLYGTVAHMVYAKEGTYLIRVQPGLVQQARTSKKALQSICALIQVQLNKLHTRFIRTPSQRYYQYRTIWLAEARRLGFDIHLYEKNQVPEIEVSYDCALNQESRYLAEVDVPDNMEPRDVEQGKRRSKTKKQTTRTKRTKPTKPTKRF